MGLASGSKLGTYEIRSPLGAGGMGEVYRATDTKLGRDVALKVLPAEMALDPERLARFRREARAVAALNHPNVVTLYSVEENDGIHFITMELVEGVSLDRRIASGGLPVDQIVEIAGALAEALAAAHEKGIVHRDLKPANVMVTNEGRVKVLDFGLAKDVSAESSDGATLTSAGHTQAGIVMGTPAYMSPEQVSGRLLDHRTDIFSLGVVLHELSTGQRPFVGHSSAELVSAILRDSPPLVTDLRSELPTDLARVIRRCLEKDPRHRVQTARDVSNEFRELSRTAAPIVPVSVSTSRAQVVHDSGSTRTDEGFWVAVLPFKYTGSNPDAVALAEGLTDDIVTGLSKFSYLRVIARSSTTRYAQQAVDVRTTAKDLGARYVMEGSVRQAGTKVRIAVQLVDANTGAGLWAETYDRSFTAESMLDLLDDVVPRIVATVGDTQGILPHSMTESLRGRDPESFTPYEALLRSFGFHQHVSAEEHLAGRTALEHAVEQAPDRADLWAMLSWLYRAEYTHEYHPRPDPMDRCLAAARRAVSLEPSNQLAQASLASAFFFRHEFGPFRAAAERALALNQMEGYTTAFLGQHFACSGDWARGVALTERAIQLNPNHPGWYWLTLVYDAYRKGDGQRAVELALKINMPQLWTVQLVLAVVHSHVGQMQEARLALRDLLVLRPPFRTAARKELEKWYLPDLIELMLTDLRKAGLEASAETDSGAGKSSASVLLARTTSGETRTEEGFWVAVLPFRYKGIDDALHSLADGLTEEVITGLSRFSYLRVIARGSTAKYSSETGDVRAIGKELGARYVMEGSLRQAGSKLRLAAQLADTVSGAHLWAETYERTFTPESVFDVQDDLVPRIVSTVADQYGILPRSMSETLRSKNEESLTPHEAVLRAFSYFARLTPEEHATVRSTLERVVRRTPDHADSWAMLAMMYIVEYSDSYNVLPNPLERALAAAQRAVDLAPSSARGYYSLAWVYFFRKEKASLHAAVEQAVALNPMDGSVIGLLGLLLHHTGEFDRGSQMVERSMQLNPNYPGVLRFTAFNGAYREGQYLEALEAAVRINMPGFFASHVALAAALGQLGRHDAAHKAVQDLLALRPDFAAVMRREYAKWFDPRDIEHLADGLRKAGLEIPDTRKEKPSGAVPTGLAQATSPSIAVLPFANMSDDKGQDYFSDGLAEEIINLMAQVPGLKVIARTSAFAFRGKEQDIRGIAETLGVNTVLEGSVRRSGNRIRVTAQLINAADGSHLWSERYDRELSDIFAVQDEISTAIAKALRVKLSRDGAQRYTPKLEAYEAYLKAKYHQAKVTPESLELARQCYEQASGLDPAFAIAHIGLAFYWFCLAHFGRQSAHECVPKARAEIRRALEIDPSLPEAHAILGYLAAMYDLDWATSDKHFSSPMAKEVGFVLVRPLYAWAQFWQGNVEQAIQLAQRAIEEDPLEIWPRMNLHAYLQSVDRIDEALEQLNKVVQLDEHQVIALVSMAMIYTDKGNLAEALRIAQRIYAIAPWFPDGIGVLAGLTRLSGKEVESSLLKALGSGDTMGDARAHALFHLLCDEIDQGADWAEKAVEERDSSMMLYLRFVVSKALRASHRWPKIAKMLNLPS